MRVSVGLSVYNSEKYLEQCLASLISQTLEDMEIIIVDDGSTDSSADICDRVAHNDKRVIVIHRPHGGLAIARQVALEMAKGDYFCVCDADDWMEPYMYETLWKQAIKTDADVVMCDYWREYDNGTQMRTVFGR